MKEKYLMVWCSGSVTLENEHGLGYCHKDVKVYKLEISDSELLELLLKEKAITYFGNGESK